MTQAPVEGRTRAPAQTKQRSLMEIVQANEAGFAAALPETGATAARFVRVALTTLRTWKPEQLAKVDPTSLLAALMTSAQLGLEPGGPLGHAYLVPYARNVTFIPGYRGLIDLARRSGHVDRVRAHAVHEGDEFEWSLGLHEDLIHRPTAEHRENAKDITHVYAVADMRGSSPVFVVLTRAEVERVRARSKAGSDGPWVTDWEAMALKTAVRRLMKWLPLSVEAAAVAVNDAVEFKAGVPFTQDSFLDHLAAPDEQVAIEATVDEPEMVPLRDTEEVPQ